MNTPISSSTSDLTSAQRQEAFRQRDCWHQAMSIDANTMLHEWRVSIGALAGDPRFEDPATTTRNAVTRDPRSGSFTKHYKHGELSEKLMKNERLIIVEAALPEHKALRSHINQLELMLIDGTSFAHCITTVDVGSNLDMWADWVPFSLINGVPTPLFANPNWLAALVHGLLLSLQRLAEAGIAHTDFYVLNCCLADWNPKVNGLLQGCDKNDDVLKASADLTALPLRVIDFELSFCRSQSNKFVPVQRHQHLNAWVSDRLMNILEAKSQDVALEQLDGRVDLWSLGQMLEQWILNAGSYWEKTNLDRPDYWYELFLNLQLFAELLKAQAPARFTQGELWSKNNLPHEALRQRLRSMGFDWLYVSANGRRDPVSQWPIWMLNPTAVYAQPASAPPSVTAPTPPPAQKQTTQQANLLTEPQPRWWNFWSRKAVKQANRTVTSPSSRSYAPLPQLTDKRYGLELVVLPAGRFQMGGTVKAYEQPIHWVDVKSFAIGKYPVTQQQWQEVMGNNPSRFKGDDRRPVECVSWDDAQRFISKLNQETGEQYRLPSEAEWEYACRAGGKGKWCFGDDESQLKEYAWYDENSGRTTHAVGQKKCNAFGLYDMHGNVWEWVQDRYHTNYEGAPTDGSTWEEIGESNSRVLRGGSWSYYYSSNLRAAYRNFSSPGIRVSNVGFRVVRTLP